MMVTLIDLEPRNANPISSTSPQHRKSGPLSYLLATGMAGTQPSVPSAFLERAFCRLQGPYRPLSARTQYAWTSKLPAFCLAGLAYCHLKLTSILRPDIDCRRAGLWQQQPREISDASIPMPVKPEASAKLRSRIR